jgi:16S rRNA (uracil1498-N3)-methyltransferase
MIRLYVPDDLSAGRAVAPSPDQARYLIGVMRQTVGDALLLFNGRDGEWRAAIEAISKRGCVLGVEAQTREQASPPDLDLIIALVKRARLETIVEKATELGARSIRLLITRRTNADHTNLARLQAIATEAAEQTGRLDVPNIIAPQKLDFVLDKWPENQQLMFCDEAGDDSDSAWGGEAGKAAPALIVLKNAAENVAQHKVQQTAEGVPPWAIVIGPEGGFAPEERARLRALPFVVPVSLGPRILRADTAAIAALTLWQAALGDWR